MISQDLLTLIKTRFNNFINVYPINISIGKMAHSLIALTQKETTKGIPYIISNHNGVKHSVQIISTKMTLNIHIENYFASSS